MRFVAIFVAVLVGVAGMTGSTNVAEAGAKPVGPPKTLASDRQVSGDEPVEPAFPIDFLGVLYEGDVEGGSVRFRHDGRWGSWVELQDDGIEVASHWASGLVSGSGAEAYQVRVPRRARAPRAVVINTTDGPAEPTASTSAACSDSTAVVTRCEWGADESLMTWAPSYYPTQKLTVHHTATMNGDDDPAATVRAIYRYQAVDRDFGDIGYQYLIDESGRVYEGRYSGEDRYPGHNWRGLKGVTAAHIGGFNAANTGIALLGNLTSREARPAARASLEGLLGELSARHGIRPRGATRYVNPVSGVTKRVANISGHRDWAFTECPGGTFYARLPAIRDAAAASRPPPDTTAPEVTEIAVSPTRRGVTVEWRTNEPSTGRVRYRRRGALAWSSSDRVATLTKRHTAVVTGLARRRTYQYQVMSADAAGNKTTTAPALFTTR